MLIELRGKVSLNELDIKMQRRSMRRPYTGPRHLQQLSAEIHTDIAPEMAALRQLARHAAIAAAEIQDVRFGRHVLQHLHHPRLQTAAAGRERRGQPLIELIVQGDESLRDGGIHALII